MFTEELSELVSRASTTESLSVCVCLWAGLKNCVCVCLCMCYRGRERVNERKGEREGGIKRKERRAVIPLWPWLRFHWACGVSWPCLDFAQEQRPAQTSYTPHPYTDIDSITRFIFFVCSVTKLFSCFFFSSYELVAQPHSSWGRWRPRWCGAFPVTHFALIYTCAT